MKYVKVVIDQISNYTDFLYTYRCAEAVHPGSVVTVPFGKNNRPLKAYVFEVSDSNEENIPRLKDVLEVSGEYSLPEDLVEICRWMRDRYMCRYIDAVRCAVPPGSAPKRGIPKDPVPEPSGKGAEEPPLTEEQEAAFREIEAGLNAAKPSYFLLNGVTSSGKTEVYMRAVAKALENGRDAIVMVPEISLTPQTIRRFANRFGKEQVAVMHSRLTKGQRYAQWMKVRNGTARIMIGARSAIFAPSADLGLIIIDEEHESSYKSDQTPKYDAVTTALKRADLTGASVVLGSATPSVISRYRANAGLYRELKLTKRYNETPLPTVHVADMRRELINGNRTMFSDILYEKTSQALAQGRQAIFFLNRRGYSSFVSCRNCGHVIRCDVCNLSMTYHKASGMAECHYCGRKVRVPDTCPECGSKHIRYFGAGTEQVQEAAAELFPGAVTDRLDLDSAGRKGGTASILSAFRKGKTDILVGTQLVAKGLDFDNVGVVGIIAADITLNIPDYRSPERTFQLIVQAAGRAGRGKEPGEVIIQTYSPEDSTIQAAAANDYDGFYEHEIRVRRLIGYPPFSNILRLVFSGSDERETRGEAERVYRMILESSVPGKGEVFAPQPAYMAKLNDKYRFHILIKSPRRRTEIYRKLIETIRLDRTASGSRVIMVAELDPYSMT